MADFDAREFWEERLASDYSLNGVGFRRLGRRYNEWAYRVRRERFRAVVLDLGIDVRHAHVLDIGSGTGFYIDCWDELGAASVTGVDITETAVTRLSARFPGKTIEQLDIGTDTGSLEPEAYDAVSAMDVLFHIVDDPAYGQAIKNIASLLKPGGAFIWSDAFVHGPSVRRRHIVHRPLAHAEQAVASAGLVVDRRVPLFVLMDNPVDQRNPVLRWAWLAAAAVVSLSDRLGGWAGRVLAPVDLRLAARRRESPTSEIMVCRKSAGSARP